jgi:competence protein ComEC
MKFLFWGVLVLLVFVRYFSTKPGYPDGQFLRITGTVRQEPSRFSYHQRISLAGLKFYLPKYPEIYYGDRIIVQGVVQKGELENASLVLKEENIILFSGFRKSVVQFFQKTLPEPHASLVAGISLGAKGSLPKDFWDSLTKTGTAHVVVASGMNVSLVASFLIGVLVLFFNRKKALILALSGIWVYTLISGFEAPIIRAAVMGSIAFTAQELGRVYSAWRALVLTGLILLIIVPAWLTDLGFILSFIATGSILIFQKKLEKFLLFVPKLIRGDFSTTLAAQVGVSPILFVTFGQFNLLSPLINVLVLWSIPLITILGIIGGVIGLFMPLAGRVVLYLAYPLTYWFIGVIRLFG